MPEPQANRTAQIMVLPVDADAGLTGRLVQSREGRFVFGIAAPQKW